MRRGHTAGPSWFDWAQVIASGILFLVCGVLLVLLWFRRRAEQRAMQAEIQHAARGARDRNRAADTESSETGDAEQGGKHRLRPDRTPKVSDHDSTRLPPDNALGKHSVGRNEDDYATTQFRVQWRDDDTMPIVRLVRPYLDYRPKRADPDEQVGGGWFDG